MNKAEENINKLKAAIASVRATTSKKDGVKLKPLTVEEVLRNLRAGKIINERFDNA